MTKTVLVAGGAGFIGSHLCELLLKEDHRVICVDSLLTGSEQNITPLGRFSDFSFIKQDILDSFLVPPKIDQIYNLACPASPVRYQKDPIHTIKTNTLGVINMIGLARLHNARILQASTSEVYGDPEKHPQDESYRGNVNPIGPRACYDEGKRVAETLFFDYHRQHGVDIRVARIFNTYGPRMAQDDGRVVSNFIVQALKGEPITIYGQGSQTRSFCHVSDLVKGLYLLMNTEDITCPVNLGNPDEHTILDIAHKVRQMTNSSSEINHLPLPEDDPCRRRPDNTLAKASLGWVPRICLEEGLQHTISYFKGVLEKKV